MMLLFCRHGMDAVRAKFEDGSLTATSIPGFEEHFACCPGPHQPSATVMMVVPLF